MAISRAFRDVPHDGPGQPTLLITTTGTYVIGIDGLQKANHGLLFNVSYKEIDKIQAMGPIASDITSRFDLFYLGPAL